MFIGHASPHHCDKCGKEVEYVDSAFSICSGSFLKNDLALRTMLCHDCQEPLVSFIKNYLPQKNLKVTIDN